MFDIYNFSGLDLIICILASFRLTHLFVFDDIMEFIRRPFVEVIVDTDENGNEFNDSIPKGTGIQKWFGSLLTCYWCLGVWFSAFVLFTYCYVPYFVPLWFVLAIAGGASILETKLYGK